MLEEKIIKTSMFGFRPNSRIEYDGSAKKGHASVKALVEKGALKSSDKAILEFLGAYGYLNAFMIRCLLTGSETGGSEEDKKSLQKALKMLVKTGLIIRFRIVYTDSFCVDHSSPFVYQLGKTQSLIKNKETRKAETDDIVDPLAVVTRLAYNQFIIAATLQYMYRKLYIAQNYGVPGTDAQLLMTLENGNKVGFNVIVVRGDTHWKDTFRHRLLARPNGFPYIAVCESEQNALEIERFHKSMPDIAKIGVFYVCDYAAISGDDVMSQIISVNAVSNFSSYDICSFDIA